MSAEAASDIPVCLGELCGLPEDDEAELLADILTRGWDQGCFLRLDGGTPLPELTPARIEALLEIVESRPRPHPEGEAVDPFETEPLADQLPEGEAPGLVVISQRCDLIKPIAAEPLVEVASATHSGNTELLTGARNNTSSQFVHLADDEDGSGWIADMRTTGHIPKHWLGGRNPCQLLPPGARRRFARRIGERRSRTPVPVAIAEGVQRPLRGWLYKGAERNALCTHFSDLLLLPVDNGSWALIAILGEGKELGEAEKAFDRLFGQIAERVGEFPLSEDDSDVLPLEQLSMADFNDAYRLDLSHVTYGSRSAGGGHAESAL